MKNTSMRNVRSTPKSMSHLAELFPHPGDADEYQPSPWFCPSARQRFPYRIMEGLLVTREQRGSVELVRSSNECIGDFESTEEAFCCPDFRVTTGALCIDPPFAKLIRG